MEVKTIRIKHICNNCGHKEQHLLKQAAAKDWMDVAIEKEAELGEQEFAQVFTMHCEFILK